MVDDFSLSIFRTLDDIHTPHGSFIQFEPHLPGVCSVPEGFTVSPPSIPWNFHDFFNWVPLPLGNFISLKSFIANEAADPRGSAVELANHRAVREYRRKISSQRKGLFLTIFGCNTPYLGTDVTFMYVSLPPHGLGVVSADVSGSEIGGPFRGE